MKTNKLFLLGMMTTMLLLGFLIAAPLFAEEPAAPATWTPAQGGFAKNILGIAYGNGTFVAVGYDDKPGEGIIAYSKDGITWTKASFRWPGFTINKIFFGGGKFFAMGYIANYGQIYISVSTDGINWINGLNIPFKTSASINGFAYGKNKDGIDIWVALFDNQISYTDTKRYNSDWNKTRFQEGNRLSPWPTDKANIFRGVFFDGSRFIAYDIAGKCLLSTDGDVWKLADDTTIPSDSIAISGKPITSIASSGSKFIGVGPDNSVGWSTDGITWTASDNKGKLRGGDLTSVAYGFGMFVAVNSRGKIIYSSDGFTWEQVISSTFGDTHIRGVVYGNSRFVAIGDNGRIAYSNKVE